MKTRKRLWHLLFLNLIILESVIKEFWTLEISKTEKWNATDFSLPDSGAL